MTAPSPEGKLLAVHLGLKSALGVFVLASRGTSQPGLSLPFRCLMDGNHKLWE